MKGRDVIVAGTAVRAWCKGIDLDKALHETLHKNGIEKITEESMSELCRDIGQAVEKKEWIPKQLTLI